MLSAHLLVSFSQSCVAYCCIFLITLATRQRNFAGVCVKQVRPFCQDYSYCAFVVLKQRHEHCSFFRSTLHMQARSGHVVNTKPHN